MEFKIVENPEADQEWAEQIERLSGFTWPWSDVLLRSILINRTDNEFSHAEVVEILSGDSPGDSTLLSCHASQGQPTFSTRLVKGLERFNAKHGIAGFRTTKGETPPPPDDDDAALDERAVAVLYKHKDWSNQQIADEVHCHVKTLNKAYMVQFKAAKAALKSVRENYRDDSINDRRIIAGPDRRRRPSNIDRRDRDEG